MLELLQLRTGEYFSEKKEYLCRGWNVILAKTGIMFLVCGDGDECEEQQRETRS
jgi:alpha-D-ribose 1-methylphosphonate 5-phosphate C-P lyase